MTNTQRLRAFAIKEQTLLLSSYMFSKWKMPTLKSVGILQNMQKEWGGR